MAPRKKSTAKHKEDDVLIPDKLYFRIGEVATLCHLPAYVLRFWESEFPQLKPAACRKRAAQQATPLRAGIHHLRRTPATARGNKIRQVAGRHPISFALR